MGEKKKPGTEKTEKIFFLDDPELRSEVPLEYLSHKEKYEEAIRKACKLFEKFNSLKTKGKVTELGHGTFIRGLETTATYDPKTEEFVLNSPTLTAYKWWPGGLGHSANYAVVVAQLYARGKCHGIHPFIVQLRDQETHEPLPGIKIGEIGCKLGMNVLVQDVATYLKKAVTIATRYSAVRHQSQIKPDEPEPQILDFVTQQHKLFPFISTCFAFVHAANWLWDVYNNVTGELETGHLDNLPELHAASCVLKAVSSADASQGVETLRLACGGHGYMTASNLPRTYGLVTAMCTYEGENTVLLLQTARFLIKIWQNKTNLQNLPTVKYLETSLYRNIPFEKSVKWIISALQQTATGKIDLASRHINERVRNGQAYEDAWNNTSIELVAAAECHGRAMIVEIYYITVQQLKEQTSKELGRVLEQLLELYAVHTALRSIGDLLRFTNVTGKDIEVLQAWLEELLAEIRPNAIGIVDSFDIRDEVLSSALGAYDGNVYERLFAEAQKSPLNAEPVNKSFHLYLKPFIKSNL
ncbi:hypothetical protein NQ314_020678 [Rhamnusium bicolor]|uniref:Acyl-coenzyme A oxidase n=1 Tax=Rhamnusium bicolor TaxID=1586634 RepID=A0AAV8WK14_9CUCU|nr:hypothetical protein NQ314_020678 [Rhamnusium bicolor]